MLCKSENRSPEHCLSEGRKVTRCTAALYVHLSSSNVLITMRLTSSDRISKMRENCLAQFDTHWNCLENNNHEYYQCRKPERALNKCMFDKLVSVSTGLFNTRKNVHGRVLRRRFLGVHRASRRCMSWKILLCVSS